MFSFRMPTLTTSIHYMQSRIYIYVDHWSMSRSHQGTTLNTETNLSAGLMTKRRNRSSEPDVV